MFYYSKMASNVDALTSPPVYTYTTGVRGEVEPLSVMSIDGLPDHVTPRGHPIQVLIHLSDKYRCGVCTLVLREPVQSTCGHR